MKLSKLLSELCESEIQNFREVEITKISQSSKKCSKTTLFVAIKGAKRDGHDYIDEAYSRGVRVFLCAKKVYGYEDAVIIYSKNTRKDMATLCSVLAGRPERHLILVGITGTKGKTTTVYILSKILEHFNVKNLTVGTLGIDNKTSASAHNTTPDPTVLFPALKRALRSGAKVALLEVSSQALKDLRIYGIAFDYVAFTGLGRDHIGIYEHPDFSDYLRAKRSLFTSYGAKRAVVNFDDAYSSYMSAGVPNVIRCGFSHGADLRIDAYSDREAGAEFTVSGEAVKTTLVGKYNATNMTIALAIAGAILDVPYKCILSSLCEVNIPGRFERHKYRGIRVIVDYAHNENSFTEVIGLARRLFGGRIISVFGSVGERSFHRRGELARVSEKMSDFSVITADTSGQEYTLSICSEIYSAYSDKTLAKIITDRREAIKYALGVAKAGDTVLLLGKGHEKSDDGLSDGEFIDRINNICLDFL